MVVVADAVVAEQVGVGGDDDAARAVLGDGERAARWVRRRRLTCRRSARRRPASSRGRSTRRSRARAGRLRPGGCRPARPAPSAGRGRGGRSRRPTSLAIAMPKRAVSSARLLPYLACSSSARTIRPPPACTQPSIASISSGVRRGERPSGTVRSHCGSLGWAITRTAVPSSGSGAAPVWACTAKPRARRAAAACAYDESAGCAGCMARATSGRIVQACEWDSSKTTRAIAMSNETKRAGGCTQCHFAAIRATIARIDAIDRQDSCAAGGGRAANVRRHRPRRSR